MFDLEKRKKKLRQLFYLPNCKVSKILGNKITGFNGFNAGNKGQRLNDKI